jgi:hypothetical protein
MLSDGLLHLIAFAQPLVFLHSSVTFHIQVSHCIDEASSRTSELSFAFHLSDHPLFKLHFCLSSFVSPHSTRHGSSRVEMRRQEGRESMEDWIQECITRSQRLPAMRLCSWAEPLAVAAGPSHLRAVSSEEGCCLSLD